MKKLINVIAVAVLALAAFSFTGCVDAVADDGSNIRSYTGSKGAGGAVPFHMYNDLFDFQFWNQNADGSANGGGAFVTSTKEEIINTQTAGSGWWGVAFVSSSSDPQPIYDMSGISTIKFQAKGSIPGLKMEVRVFNASSKDTLVTLTDEYEEYEVPVATGGNNDNAFLVWLSEDSHPGESWYIKNIAFYDSSDMETIPKIKK